MNFGPLYELVMMLPPMRVQITPIWLVWLWLAFGIIGTLRDMKRKGG